MKTPNGMDFDKPEIEQYYELKMKEHWAEEDGPEPSKGESNPAEAMTDWMAHYRLCDRVENSRFVHRPVAGYKKED